jgi:small-conductance mechanosensitive channel
MSQYRFLCVLILALLTPLAQAQIPFLKPQTDAPKAASAPTAVDARAQAEALLAEARRQQEAGQAAADGAKPTEAEGLTATDRQRLLDRLVVAYGENLKLLDEFDTQKQSPRDNLLTQSLIAEFAAAPPYSALQVDVLRDEYDATRERLQSLTSTERALETLKIGRIDAQRRASEAVRLSEDKLARAKGPDEIARERVIREWAALRRQLAEADLANIVIALDRTALEMKGKLALSGEMERLLARVLREQRLSKEELEQQKGPLRKELNKVIGEIDAIVSANTRRTKERARLATLAAASGSGLADVRRLQLMDARLDTDRVELLTLSWLQSVLQTASDAWSLRYVGFHSEDAGTRQEVISGLQRIRDELNSRKQITSQLQQAARVEVREQSLRLENAATDADTALQETSLLDALQQRLQAYQRLERASERLDRQLGRWLEDLGFRANTAGSDDWKLAFLQLTQTLKKVWDFEMFAVEDSSLIDGKTVTVTYGVTVGKSIGALLLFLLGYWLFARLSRRLQKVMVSRFGVDQQVASVIRRWAMIALAVVLVILILNLARIPLTVFAFMGGALAIGIGFGAQTIIKNVISGIIILFERKIRVGDMIALGGMTGHVVAVDLRASTVRGFDGVEALVPNSNFLENQVLNWTYSSPRQRREVRIGIAYGAPVHEAADIIVGCAMDHGQILKDPSPEVYFEDFGDNSLLLLLMYWVELGPSLNSRRVDSDIRFAVEKRLAAAGIPIPFPQRDVHLDVSRPLPVCLSKDAGDL